MKKVSSKNVISALVAGTLLATGNMAMAANDGALGAESTGDLTVRAILNPAVQITKLTDIDLNMEINEAGDAVTGRTGTSSACIYNSNGSEYSISAAGAGGSFVMTNDTADTISYSVRVDDNSGDGYTAFNQGVSLNKSGASNSLSCNGGTNAEIQVTANQADVIAAGAGVFSSILSITVKPL